MINSVDHPSLRDRLRRSPPSLRVCPWSGSAGLKSGCATRRWKVEGRRNKSMVGGCRHKIPDGIFTIPPAPPEEEGRKKDRRLWNVFHTFGFASGLAPPEIGQDWAPCAAHRPTGAAPIYTPFCGPCTHPRTPSSDSGCHGDRTPTPTIGPPVQCTRHQSPVAPTSRRHQFPPSDLRSSDLRPPTFSRPTPSVPTFFDPPPLLHPSAPPQAHSSTPRLRLRKNTDQPASCPRGQRSPYALPTVYRPRIGLCV
jgi:hypothetical protein